MLRSIVIVVPFLGLSCVSTPEYDVDLRFDNPGKRIYPVADANRERPDPVYLRHNRLDHGMSFEQVRAIFNREPSRDEVRDGGRFCSWSFDGGAYVKVEFDAQNKLKNMMPVPRI